MNQKIGGVEVLDGADVKEKLGEVLNDLEAE